MSPASWTKTGCVFLQDSNSRSVLGAELVLLQGKRTVVAVTEFVRIKNTVETYCVVPALCKFFNIAVVLVLGAGLHRMQWAESGSFLCQIKKSFWSLESEHFQIYMRKNFVSGPDSALAKLPFPVQFSIILVPNWPFKYLSLWFLLDRSLCLLHLNRKVIPIQVQSRPRMV